MHRATTIIALVLTILYGLLPAALPAQVRIGVIDVYGNQSVAATTIRERLGYKEGDTISRETFDKAKTISALKSIPGVLNADIDIVCCDDNTGGNIMYVGIAEDTTHRFVYYSSPKKSVSLPVVIMQTYEGYMNLMTLAVQQGRAEEDHSMGYALIKDSAARLRQLDFVTYAKQYATQLHTVLHQSADADQRAIAAMVIAYGPDKKAAAAELSYAVHDPNEEVRNNATRALWVLATWLQEHPEAKITIPASPFVSMLNSLVWTDRNKGSLVLFALTQQRDPAVLAALKKKCLPSLIQMAHWKSMGHALQSYLMIARLAGISDDDAFKALTSDNKEAFLEQMIIKAKQ